MTQATTAQPVVTRPGRTVTAVGLLLIAANLRPAVVTLSPLMPTISADIGLSATVAGLLTTSALICFGLLAPLAPRIAHRLGLDPTLALALGLVIAGILVRTVPSTAALFGGTVLASAGIGMGNVLLPSVIKRDFSDRPGLMTGLYSMALTGGATLAAGLVVPLTHSIGRGWRVGLVVWVGFGVVALVAWLPQLRRAKTEVQLPDEPDEGRLTTEAATHRSIPLWHQPLAWAVTVFMGTQSLIFYAAVAWLPVYFVAHGYSETAAGGMLALSNAAGIVGALSASPIAGRMRRQRALAVATAVVSLVGLVGLVLAPQAGPVWMVFLGIGPGAAISLALLFMVLRSSSSPQTARLSGMAQSVGYLVAALGPFAIGAIHDLTGSWSVALAVLAAVALPQAAAGWVAGRGRLSR